MADNDDTGRAAPLSRADALAIFRTWVEDKSLVRCELHLHALAATFRGRAAAASETEFRLMADDTWAELVLPLRPDFTFRYTDMLDSPRHSAEFDHLIVIFFPYPRGASESGERIVLTEIKE